MWLISLHDFVTHFDSGFNVKQMLAIAAPTMKSELRKRKLQTFHGNRINVPIFGNFITTK